MYHPLSDAAKLLRVLVEEIGAMSPRAFEKIDVDAALQQIDESIGNSVLNLTLAKCE